jgi:hypothetical protein
MTFSALAVIIRRRWYAAAAVLIIGVLTLGAVRSLDPVYWTKAEVSFVAAEGQPWYFIQNADVGSLVEFAALVQRRVSSSPELTDLVVSPGTLYGAGVKHGYSVTLPNRGGQWARSFSRPVLEVQVVGSSAEMVNQQLGVVIEQIKSATVSLQQQAGLSDGLIYTVTTPASPEIVFGGGTASNRFKGAFTWLCLAGGLAVLSAVLTDRHLPKRTRMRPRAQELR